jgi:ABC-type Mn2+/Zn2+ transport system permease subunit
MSAIGVVLAVAMFVAPAIVAVGWLQEKIERRAIVQRRLKGLPAS